MRGAPVAAAAALVVAVLGAAAALVIARGAGWVGSGHSQTVYLTSTPSSAGAATASATSSGAARPLPGNGFDPALLYRRRSSGVVTVFS
jgi:hypothetical protein